jgi:hypothetical protein
MPHALADTAKGDPNLGAPMAPAPGRYCQKRSTPLRNIYAFLKLETTRASIGRDSSPLLITDRKDCRLAVTGGARNRRARSDCGIAIVDTSISPVQHSPTSLGHGATSSADCEDKHVTPLALRVCLVPDRLVYMDEVWWWYCARMGAARYRRWPQRASCFKHRLTACRSQK